MSFYEELKRRSVFRVGAVYAVVSWVVIQVADTLFPALQMPDWTVTFVTVLLILGFFPTMVAAWAYDRTPEGMRPEHGVQASTGSAATSAQPINYLILVVVLVMTGVQIYDRTGVMSSSPSLGFGSADDASSLLRISIAMPPDQDFSLSRGDFDIAPDGSFFVYTSGLNERTALWLRRFDSLEATPIAGTESPTRPRISPDGSMVTFNSRGRIRAVPIGSGIARTLTNGGSDTPNWSSDGEFIFFRDGDIGLSRVPAEGGDIEELTRVNTQAGELFHVFPEPLPDGEKILFQAMQLDGNDIIYGLDLASGDRKAIVEGMNPNYSNTGHLLFQGVGDTVLYAVPFDAEVMELTGEPVQIAESLFQVGIGGSANIGLSDTGRLLYRGYGDISPTLVPTLIDRAGQERELEQGWSLRGNVGTWGLALSPQADRLAINLMRNASSSDVWVKDLNQGPFSRMTFTGENVRPTWSADGEDLLFISRRINGRNTIWSRRADGGGVANEILLSDARVNINNVVATPDGRHLIFRANNNNEESDLFFMEIEGEQVQTPLVDDDFGTANPEVSPDGRWIAYASDETGDSEIYVIPTPSQPDSGKWLVSNAGGSNPLWSRDGTELYYINPSSQLVAVELEAGDEFAWNNQEPLFSFAGFQFAGPGRMYDVMPNGEFVAIRIRSNAQFIMVDNWFAEVR